MLRLVENISTLAKFSSTMKVHERLVSIRPQRKNDVDTPRLAQRSLIPDGERIREVPCAEVLMKILERSAFCGTKSGTYYRDYVHLCFSQRSHTSSLYDRGAQDLSGQTAVCGSRLYGFFQKVARNTSCQLYKAGFLTELKQVDRLALQSRARRRREDRFNPDFDVVIVGGTKIRNPHRSQEDGFFDRLFRRNTVAFKFLRLQWHWNSGRSSVSKLTNHCEALLVQRRLKNPSLANVSEESEVSEIAQ